MKTLCKTIFIVAITFFSLNNGTIHGQENTYPSDEEQIWKTRSESTEKAQTAISASLLVWGLALGAIIAVTTILATNNTNDNTKPSP